MTKIYTRTGDSGETGLFDGTRVVKSDLRVEAYGAVDELNAWLGLIRAVLFDNEIAPMLLRIQRDLHAVGAQLADPQHKIASRVAKAAITSDDVTRLEQWIDTLDASLPQLRRFILAGGSEPGALLHISRTVCRRAERRIVSLTSASESQPSIPAEPAAAPDPLVVYINRLSDLLFVMARAVNHRVGVPETEW